MDIILIIADLKVGRRVKARVEGARKRGRECIFVSKRQHGDFQSTDMYPQPCPSSFPRSHPTSEE
jgi:hypothetical protein